MPLRTVHGLPAIERIAQELPGLLAAFSIARGQIIADQWMSALRSGEVASIVAVVIMEQVSADEPAMDPVVTTKNAERSLDSRLAGSAVAIHPPGSDSATLLFASVNVSSGSRGAAAGDVDRQPGTGDFPGEGDCEPGDEKSASENDSERHLVNFVALSPLESVTTTLSDGIAKVLSERGVDFVQWATDPTNADSPGAVDEGAADAGEGKVGGPHGLPARLQFSALGDLQYLTLNDLKGVVGTKAKKAIGSSPAFVLSSSATVSGSASVPGSAIELRNVYRDPGEDSIGDSSGGTAEDDAACDRFAKLVERTYVDSLDCPGFANFRTARQLLQSYRESPTFHRPGWNEVHFEGNPIGALIIALHEKADGPHVAELTYMGLRPEMRGRGLGRLLLDSAIAWAANAECGRLILAVDVNNHPALDLYRDVGFEPILRESVWGRKLAI
ncbi:MAG: GNAT family N-acetyltransferase [Planctomycetota bacterium]